MTLQEELVKKATAVEKASTAFHKMVAVLELKEFLDTADPMELFLSVNAKLGELEIEMTEEQKDTLRGMGYSFYEDLDEPRKMFCE